MESHDLFFRFGVSLLVGMLVGMQREFAFGSLDKEMFAGIRTFALMGLFGCTAAMLADLLGTAWIYALLALGLMSLIIFGYYIGATQRGEVGLTTEVAALLVILIGALCYYDHLALAAALGVGITVLLALDEQMRSFIRRITAADIYATLRFAVITAIVLPVLPKTPLGSPPLDVLNLHKIWQMVVLISGISFLGYILIKLVGPKQGIGLSGFLGGLASSTAVTISFSQRSREHKLLAKPFALAIIIAWTVMFFRVLVVVSLINSQLLWVLWPPITVAGLLGLSYCIYLYFGHRVDETSEVSLKNPFEIGPAITFGILYAVILLISHTAQIYLGNTGVYISSLVAGLADVDAITLSMAELSRDAQGLGLVTAQRAIVLATMSNTAVKGGIVLSAGSRELRRILIPVLLVILFAGVAVAFLTN